MLGRLHPIKAVDRVLAALAIMHRRGIPARQEFAGSVQDDRYRDQLIRQAEELGLSQHFKLVGPVFGQDLLAFYSRCAVLVIASHSENFSNVVIEAHNVETPVEASLGTPGPNWPRLAAVSGSRINRSRWRTLSARFPFTPLMLMAASSPELSNCLEAMMVSPCVPRRTALRRKALRRCLDREMGIC